VLALRRHFEYDGEVMLADCANDMPTALMNRENARIASAPPPASPHFSQPSRSADGRAG